MESTAGYWTAVFHASSEAEPLSGSLAPVGTLASGIAHDFNNLLGGVMAMAELALAELAAGSSPEEELTKIATTALRGSEIVRQLMAYAGKESDTLELVGVSQFIQENGRVTQGLGIETRGAGNRSRKGPSGRSPQPGATAAGSDEPHHQFFRTLRRR